MKTYFKKEFKEGKMAKKREDVITEVLKMIAPGTPIRDGLENILKAKTGALIVIGENRDALELVDGGFKLDIEYTSSRLYELAKMDGAIVLSSDFKDILYANAQLIPSSNITTTETGTRHRTAGACKYADYFGYLWQPRGVSNNGRSD